MPDLRRPPRRADPRRGRGNARLSRAGGVYRSEGEERTMSGPEFLHGGKLARNEGIALDLDAVMAVAANTSAIERRAATLGTRRSVKKDWQAAWLLKAVTCIDLTTLAGDDTEDRVRRLCRKATAARPPRPPRPRSAWPTPASPPAPSASTTTWSPPPSRRSEGTAIPVAAVSTGFPAGLSPLDAAHRARSRPPSPPARARSTSSSPAATSSPATGRRSTTRSAPSAPPAARRT